LALILKYNFTVYFIGIDVICSTVFTELLTADGCLFCFRKEEDSRHRSKHKKTKKVKEEPNDDEDNAIPTIKSER